MARLQHLAILLLLSIPAFLPNTVFAENRYNYYTANSVNQKQGSLSATCALEVTKLNAGWTPAAPYVFHSQSEPPLTDTTSGFNSAYCKITCNSPACGTTTVNQTSVSYTRVNDCPSGQVFNTTTNTCGTPPPPPCTAGENKGYKGAKQPAGVDFSNLSTSNVNRYSCDDGCETKLNPAVGPDWTGGSYNGSYYVFGSAFTTGNSCTVGSTFSTSAPAPENPSYKSCAEQGKSYGTVNGTGVCVNVGTPGSNPVIQNNKPTSSSNTTTQKDATGATTGSSSTSTSGGGSSVFNPDGSVTTSTEETTQNADGTSSVADKVKTQSMSDFCKDNPTNAICKAADKSSYEDSCSNGVSTATCSGDAIQCAIAKKMNDARCADLKTDSVNELGERLITGNATAADLGGSDTFSTPHTVDIGSLDTTSVLPKGCLPDQAFSLGGYSIVLPLSQLCDGLQTAGKIVLAFAYMLAARIVFS
jgi:hypothetical protein